MLDNLINLNQKECHKKLIIFQNCHYDQVFLKKNHFCIFYHCIIKKEFVFLVCLQNNKKEKDKNIFHILAFDKNICFSIFIKKKIENTKVFCMYFRLYNNFMKSIRI